MFITECFDGLLVDIFNILNVILSFSEFPVKDTQRINPKRGCPKSRSAPFAFKRVVIQ